MMNKLMNKQSFKLKWDSVFLHKEKLVEKPLLKMLYMAVVLTLLAFLYISGVGCVWRFLFHYPCPGCGITRACVALVHGDFKAAFEYNYMFISLPIIFAYILFDGRIVKSKKIDYTILSIIMFGFLIHWILTLCNY